MKVSNIILDRALDLMPELNDQEQTVLASLINNEDLEGVFWFLKHQESIDSRKAITALLCASESNIEDVHERPQ